MNSYTRTEIIGYMIMGLKESNLTDKLGETLAFLFTFSPICYKLVAKGG